MNRQKSFDPILRLLLLFAIVLIFAASASAEWKEKVLYSFQGIPDGAYPAGGVVFDQAGNLYGATTYGGANNCPGVGECGTVYQLQPPLQKGKPWREKTLYIFKGANDNDGSSPSGGVLMDQAGNLYGTNAYGGTGKCQLFGSRTGCGTIYELIPPKQKNGPWTEKVLYSFQGGKDGQFPWGDLTFDSAGNLYGATQFGGGEGTTCNAFYEFCGTVFRLSPPKTKGGKWTERNLHSFAGGADGAGPNGGLAVNSKGELYGTTYYGGNQGCSSSSGTGCGTVFKLKPPVFKGAGWAEKVLLRFNPDGSMGESPAAGLIFGADGDLYGTTSFGGQAPSPSGTIFRLHSGDGGRSWNQALLYSFSGQGLGGHEPLGSLVQDTTGEFYGTASSGGLSGKGTTFRLTSSAEPQKWTYTVLYSFGNFPDAAAPESNLIFDKDGRLFGTTLYGGSAYSCQGHCGTIFELQP